MRYWPLQKILCTTFVLILFCPLLSFAEVKITQPRVIWHKNPATSAIVVWTTNGPTTTNAIHYDINDRSSKVSMYKYVQNATVNTSYTDESQAYVHQVVVKDLTPDTTYYFVLTSDSSTSKQWNFHTAPVKYSPKNSAFTLLFGGDSRSDRANRKKMNLILKSLLERDHNTLALVHGGDYIYDGSVWQQWSDWLDDYQLTTTNQGRLLPIIPTRGNHELDLELFNKIFAYPGEGNSYYNLSILALDLIVLNTEISTGGEQKTWLEQQLQNSSQQSRWIIANYHRPAWPAVKLPSGAKKNWVPLFEKYLIDLAFESDGHVLKKTVPIRNNTVDLENGIIYVGEGGLGVKQRTPFWKKKWYLQPPGHAKMAHHIQMLTLKNDSLIYDVILDSGKKDSTLVLKPRNRKI